MHRLLRKHTETVALVATLIAVMAPFIPLWHLVIEPQHPGLWVRMALSAAATVLIGLLAGPVHRHIEHRLNPRGHVEGPRPTNPDGSPYGYHQIKAGGWEYCDGCRMWGQGWTPENPHQCKETYVNGPVTDRKASR